MVFIAESEFFWGANRRADLSGVEQTSNAVSIVRNSADTHTHTQNSVASPEGDRFALLDVVNHHPIDGLVPHPRGVGTGVTRVSLFLLLTHWERCQSSASLVVGILLFAHFTPNQSDLLVGSGILLFQHLLLTEIFAPGFMIF